MVPSTRAVGTPESAAPSPTPAARMAATPSHAGGLRRRLGRSPGGSASLALAAARVVVAVVAGGLFDLGVVEDDPEHPRLRLLQLALDPALGGLVLRSRANDVEDAVRERREQEGVGVQQARRAIDQHEVRLGGERRDDRLHPPRTDQLVWIRWRDAGGHQPHPGEAAGEEDLLEAGVADDQVGEAWEKPLSIRQGAADMEQRRAAEVGVD